MIDTAVVRSYHAVVVGADLVPSDRYHRLQYCVNPPLRHDILFHLVHHFWWSHLEFSLSSSTVNLVSDHHHHHHHHGVAFLSHQGRHCGWRVIVVVIGVRIIVIVLECVDCRVISDTIDFVVTLESHRHAIRHRRCGCCWHRRL